MITVRNKRTGVETTYPDHQARWLIKIGRCVEVKAKPEKEPVKKAQKKDKKTYKTKDLKAETSEDVAVQTKAKKPKQSTK